MSEDARQSSNRDQQKVNEILDVVMAYARMDFTRKTRVEDRYSLLDAIGAGVNMLGEELQSSTFSLREKEQMLKEIHHRVKNNLQIVSSLLNLQSENNFDAKFQALISASRNRINSIALVHEMLYSSTDLKGLDLGKYIQRLSQNILQSMAPPHSDIRFHYKFTGQVYVDIDRMIPVGLILNEAITNSIKYAFPSGTGLITIGLAAEENKKVLSVSDNGVGLPNGFTASEGGSLGMQLIDMLSEQIGAQKELSRDKGLCYTFAFS